MAKFYYLPNQKFSLTHPSDNDLRLEEKLHTDSMKLIQNVINKQTSLKLHAARRLEREVLQKASSQHASFRCDKMYKSFQPEIQHEIKKRKHSTYVDPSKKKNLHSNFIFDYDNLTDRQFRTLLLPNVIKKDFRIFI